MTENENETPTPKPKPRSVVAGPLGAWMVMQDTEGGLWIYGPDHKEGTELPRGETLTEFSHGMPQSRSTLTRIGAGALVAGPLGAVVGAGVRKDNSKVYGTVVAPEVTALIEVAATKETALRNFLRIVDNPPAPLTREQMVAKDKNNAVAGYIAMGVVGLIIVAVVVWVISVSSTPAKPTSASSSSTVGVFTPAPAQAGMVSSITAPGTYTVGKSIPAGVWAPQRFTSTTDVTALTINGIAARLYLPTDSDSGKLHVAFDSTTTTGASGDGYQRADGRWDMSVILSTGDTVTITAPLSVPFALYKAT